MKPPTLFLSPSDRLRTLAGLLRAPSSAPSSPPAALELWFARVQDQPLHTLDLTDLAQALRQSLGAPLVPLRALELLVVDPLAGHQYPGELLAALASNPSVLPTHPPARAALHHLCSALQARPQPHDLDAETWAEVLADAQALRLALSCDAQTAPAFAAPLLVRAELSGGQTYEAPLDGPVSVGRSPTATLCVSGAPSLARNHALLLPTPQGARVELFGHAASLNGERLVERGELLLGDLLDLAGVRVSLVRVGASPTAAHEEPSERVQAGRREEAELWRELHASWEYLAEAATLPLGYAGRLEEVRPAYEALYARVAQHLAREDAPSGAAREGLLGAAWGLRRAWGERPLRPSDTIAVLLGIADGLATLEG